MRVRARLNVKRAGVDVYFRSFDVDDPLIADPRAHFQLELGLMWDSNHEIDPNENGRDNRGRLEGISLSQNR